MTTLLKPHKSKIICCLSVPISLSSVRSEKHCILGELRGDDLVNEVPSGTSGGTRVQIPRNHVKARQVTGCNPNRKAGMGQAGTSELWVQKDTFSINKRKGPKITFSLSYTHAHIPIYTCEPTHVQTPYAHEFWDPTEKFSKWILSCTFSKARF